jgi:hypothetical protein
MLGAMARIDPARPATRPKTTFFRGRLFVGFSNSRATINEG